MAVVIQVPHSSLKIFYFMKCALAAADTDSISLFHQGHYHHQAECLGTSRQVRKGVISLASRNLEASTREEEISSVCLGPLGFDNEGKRNTP